MSKYRFKGKTCVYCLTEPSTPTGDHVFAREFFLPERRNNLPKVPACLSCNGEKSVLEHRLTALLPFGAQHMDVIPDLTNIGKRVAKNAKLRRELAASISSERVETSPGVYARRLAIPFLFDDLHDLFAFIVKGLIWHHWSVELPDRFGVKVGSITTSGEQVFAELQTKNVNQSVVKNLGNGTFTYQGAQGADYPELTVWVFSIYGGVKLSGLPESQDNESSRIGDITARQTLLESPAFKALFRACSHESKSLD